MRVGNIVWAALAGCGGGGPNACEALMHCARQVNPFLVAGLTADYGDDGRCWADREAEACEDACTDELVSLWVATGAAGCDPEPITGEPMLSEPAFAEAYWALLCDLSETCTGHACSDEPPDAHCGWGSFDPERAAACLETPPQCVDDDRWPYIETSAPCREVCDFSSGY